MQIIESNLGLVRVILKSIEATSQDFLSVRPFHENDFESQMRQILEVRNEKKKLKNKTLYYSHSNSENDYVHELKLYVKLYFTGFKRLHRLSMKIACETMESRSTLENLKCSISGPDCSILPLLSSTSTHRSFLVLLLLGS